MKRITAIALFAAAATLGLGTAFAQENAVRATMPFDFTVGSKTLPAGTYTISRFHNELIEIRGIDTDAAALSDSFSDDTQATTPVLIFDKCGGDYFLREVLGASEGAINLNIPLSKSEERLRKQENMARSITRVTIPLSQGD